MKCRSKPELARILGKNFDLSSFDYRSGRVLQSAIRKSKRLKGSSYDYARGKLHTQVHRHKYTFHTQIQRVTSHCKASTVTGNNTSFTITIM